MKARLPLLTVVIVAILTAASSAQALAAPAQYVVFVSADGLGSSYLQSLIDKGDAPNFRRFQAEGAWTNNARTDYDWTVTLPNHTCMITGRGVEGPAGHHWTKNVDPAPGETLHSHKGSYVASVFDVAHDSGLRTCLFAGKTKFVLYANSYDGEHGAADPGAIDHDRNKIDVFEISADSAAMVRDFVADCAAKPFHFSFIHFADPDAAGHPFGWGGEQYLAAVRRVDKGLGDIFRLVETQPAMRGRTAIILTADHGGKGHDHKIITEPLDYTIPFYVWGAGVAAGKDLYALNRGSRLDPGAGRPSYAAAAQPIRTGDVANLALGLLGLGAVPGSTINVRQDLNVAAAAEPAKAARRIAPRIGKCHAAFSAAPRPTDLSRRPSAS